MMQNINGTPIPWPNRARFPQSPMLADELDRITSENFVMDDPDLTSRIGLLAMANGLETFEAREFVYNATVVALQQLTKASLARVTPSLLMPTISVSIDSANLSANDHPIELVDDERLNGAKHVPSIVHAKSSYLNVRNQDYSAIQDEPEYIQSLGLGEQAFQPFAWLFVERANSSDMLQRYRNPFETTLFTAVRKTLKYTVPGGDSLLIQGFSNRSGIGRRR